LAGDLHQRLWLSQWVARDTRNPRPGPMLT
jgi:hypothetical protein